MSKKRKTKREKLISDLRKKLEQTTPVVVSPAQSSQPKHYSLQNISINPSFVNKTIIAKERNYSYVKQDIIKTSSIISVLFGINLLLFILTEKNIINLSSLGL